MLTWSSLGVFLYALYGRLLRWKFLQVLDKIKTDIYLVLNIQHYFRFISSIKKTDSYLRWCCYECKEHHFCYALGLSCIYLSYYRKLCYLLSQEMLDHISVYCHSHISHIYKVVWWYGSCSHNKLMYAYHLKTTIQCLGMKFKFRRHFNSNLHILLIDVKLWVS